MRAFEAQRTALEERNRAIRKLKRGYKYIGENYHRWLEEAITRMRDATIKQLGLPESEIFTADLNLEIDPHVIPLTVPQLTEYGSDQYPLPEKVGCTLYFVLNTKMIVVPAGGIHIHEPSDVRREQERSGDTGTQSKKQFFFLDLKGISQDGLDEGASGYEPIKPHYISSYELEFIDLAAVDCNQVDPGKNVITMKLNNGNLAEVIGSQRLANLLRQKVRQ